LIRGLYTAAAGMLTMQRQQESLSNNLANINTPGYKEDEGVIRSFPEQLIMRIRDQQGPDIQGWPNPLGQPVPIGGLHTGVYMSEALPNFAQGDIQQTDNPYDIALTDNLPVPENPAQINGKPVQPKLFFMVAKLENREQLTGPVQVEQIRYTRSGNFNVNPDGYLVTADGYYVLDRERQPIQINNLPDGFGNTLNVGQDLKISATGGLYYPNPADPAGRDVPLTNPNSLDMVEIGLTRVDNPYELVREGNNVYRYQGAAQLEPIDPADPAVNGYFALRQGWIERANVNPTRTMTDMLAVLRAYEANQRVITTLDGTMDKAVNDIGRVNG